MYIRDMKNTKGHISGCTFGAWHPTDRYTAITSSEDGSVRLWDCKKIEQKTVIKPQLAKPGNNPPGPPWLVFIYIFFPLLKQPGRCAQAAWESPPARSATTAT